MNEPRNLTEAIVRVQTELRKLPWAEQTQFFGRVQLQEKQGLGQYKPQTVPMALNIETGEYTDARPNDNFTSVMFFFPMEAEQSDFDRAKFTSAHIIRSTRKVRLVGWVNLAKLPTKGTDGFFEANKQTLKSLLKWTPCVKAIGEYEDRSLAKVFDGMQVTDVNKKYDQYPFTCFRIDLTLYMIEHDRPQIIA